jgi:hypothetical protein
MFSLTTTHLRFVCEATTPLRLEVDTYRAGSNLRGALGQVMQRTYCAHRDPKGFQNPSGLECPVCWLLAANEHPGVERRGYALVPPLSEHATGCLNPGERFEFGLTLFGNALQFLPYFVLAVPEMGRLGVGPGRGRFTLKSLWAVNPLSGERECMMAEGTNLVHTPTLTLTHAQVQKEAEGVMQTLVHHHDEAASTDYAFANRKTLPAALQDHADALPATNGRIEVRFVTPMRLIVNDALCKTPAFGVLFARLLKRLDELEMQFGDGTPRARDEVQALHELAQSVESVEDTTRWVEVWSGSTRRGKPSPLSGFVGRAVYAAPPDVWQRLLPWLLWGVPAQVGKDTVKGNGVIAIAAL